MSGVRCTHDHGVEALAQAPAHKDPTQSKTLRKRYAQRLRGQLATLSATVREWVQSRDLFNLRDGEALQPRDPTPPNPRDYQFTTDDRKVEAFLRWLRRQERRGVLEVIGPDDNPFVRSAYAKGIRHADQQLNAQGVTVPEQDLQAIFNTPIHRDALQLLYTRNFQQLEGVTEALNQQISRELADGFAAGENPTDIARRITDRIDKIGKTRATVLARTEVINTHATATLNRYERLGVEEVGAQVEFQTAGDSRVCPICASLEGTVYTIEEARGRIPVHPQCRCAWLPVVNSSS